VQKQQVKIATTGIFSGANPFLATSAAVLVLIFLIFTSANLELADGIYVDLQRFISTRLATYLVWTVTLVAGFAIILAASPFGQVKLGRDDEQPAFGRFSWFAMLFSAGVGTGLLFWGVAEPIFHFQANPFITNAGIEPQSEMAATVAMRITLFHWGLHGWAIYSMVGLCLGYFAFRKGLPFTVRSALYPFLGDRIYGPIGHAIDLLAIFSTVFGIATTLGLGAAQMNGALKYLFDVEVSATNQLILIICVSAIATLSAVSGIRRGIRRLSELNIWLSLVLLGFVILAGPSAVIFATFFSGSVDYFATFLPMGVWVDPDTSSHWQSTWTIFYWGWWISWGPFVGMFMATISRGRTIREYLIATLLAPTITGFFWLSVFGATALDFELTGSGGLVEAVNADMTAALFTALEMLNVEWATFAIITLSAVLIVTWFVTSSDSGTLVICTILCFGNTRPPHRFRVFWGMSIGLVAGVLLLVGGLGTLQAASTAIAIPFSIVMVLMLLGLGISLWQTEAPLIRRKRAG
jgi:choline/glycine/proline betaine transport protein